MFDRSMLKFEVEHIFDEAGFHAPLLEGGCPNEGSSAPLVDGRRHDSRHVPAASTAISRPMMQGSKRLFSLIESKDILGLNALNISLDDAGLKNDKGQSLIECIVDARYQRMMNFFFDTVVIPYYEEEGKINLKKRDKYATQILGYAILFNQVSFIKENLTEIVKENLFSQLSSALAILYRAAIEYDYLEMMEILIQQGASVNSVLGKTPLTYAARVGSVNAIDLLLHRGAQGIDRVCDKYTPLQWAMLNGHYHAFMCLLSHGATVSSTWLYLAVKGKNIQIISKILEMEDLDINAINNEGMTALEVAITQGSLPIFNLLVTRGANVAQINSNGDSILHLAALKRQMPIIQRILEMNILNINVVNEESGEAPLHVALHEVAERDNASSADVIAIFASYGANLDAVTREDDIEEGEVFAGRRTPLYFAIEAGDVAAVHALLQRGVDCNALTSGGCTPLDFAMKIKNGAIIRALSQKGATLSVPPTVEKMAKALVGLFDAQKRCLDESVDSPSKRVKPS